MILGVPLWFIFALSASIVWGLGYVLSEQLLKTGITPAFLVMCQAIIVLPLYAISAWSLGNPAEEIRSVLSNKTLLFYMLISSLAILGGNFLILYGISVKNATMVSMIEISYPFFIVLFSWLFFKDIQINWWTALGGVSIFTGVCIIYLKGGA
ncbi:MAG: hypothetical protein COB76_07165 [Alphaproteobacteria bacterium]|nr:MAG: hypothetical protein COB76_07165 [Alphaproteobacteria bacterium]